MTTRRPLITYAELDKAYQRTRVNAPSEVAPMVAVYGFDPIDYRKFAHTFGEEGLRTLVNGARLPALESIFATDEGRDALRTLTITAFARGMLVGSAAWAARALRDPDPLPPPHWEKRK